MKLCRELYLTELTSLTDLQLSKSKHPFVYIHLSEVNVKSAVLTISLYVTRSRVMNRISGILILSYRLTEVTNSYVLHCFSLFLNLKECSYLSNQMSN